MELKHVRKMWNLFDINKEAFLSKVCEVVLTETTYVFHRNCQPVEALSMKHVYLMTLHYRVFADVFTNCG